VADRVVDDLPPASSSPGSSSQGSSSGESAVGDVEVLQLGPSGAPLGRARRGLLLVLLLALALVGAGATVGWRWWVAADPTLSSDEIVSAFRSAKDVPGTPPWNPDSITVETDAPEPEAGITPLVSAAWVPIGHLDGDDNAFGGTAITSRFVNPERARAKLRLVNAALGRCARFGSDEFRYRLGPTSVGREEHGRAQTSYQLTIDAGPGNPDRVESGQSGPGQSDDGDPTVNRSTLHLTLVRFGNTLTWLVASEGQAANTIGNDRLPDRVLTGLRDVYRERS
jgi:hypothetical protein